MNNLTDSLKSHFDNYETAEKYDLDQVEVYDESYFLDGVKTGVSLYENYRWIPELTIPFVKRVIEYAGICADDTVLDFGCARGYVVKAFRQLGYRAYGADCSIWAIENCDIAVRPYLSLDTRPYGMVDWILAKDVLEHLGHVNLFEVLRGIGEYSNKGFLFIVPLSEKAGSKYVVPEYEMDVTHVQRLPLLDWYRLIHEAAPEFQINCSFRVPGMKDNYAQFPEGNGILIGKRCR